MRYFQSWKLLILVSCFISSIKPIFASTITPLPVGQLEARSSAIMLGVVTEVTSQGYSDLVIVRVVSVLKGSVKERSITLKLSPRGLKDFDPALKVGDQGVFFLKSLKNGEGELAYWGSVAIFSKPNFSTDAKGDASQ